MFKNAYLNKLQLDHSRNVASKRVADTADTQEPSAEIKQLQTLSQIFAEHPEPHVNAKPTQFDTPLLFNIVKVTEQQTVTRYEEGVAKEFKENVDKTVVMVVEGPAQDLKKLRTTRLEGEPATGSSEKPFGVFFGAALLGKDDEDTKNIKATLPGRCRNIQALELAATIPPQADEAITSGQIVAATGVVQSTVSAQDASRMFSGLALLADQNHFRKTEFFTQAKDFVAKYPKLVNTLSLIKLYNGNYPQDKTNNLYGELISSIKFLKHYQTIEQKPEGLPADNFDVDFTNLARFLPEVDIATTQTFAAASTADATSANKLIVATRNLRATLKLETSATNTEITEAVGNFKKNALGMEVKK